IFPHHGAVGRLDLLHDIAVVGHGTELRVQTLLIGEHRCRRLAQGRPRRSSAVPHTYQHCENGFHRYLLLRPTETPSIMDTTALRGTSGIVDSASSELIFGCCILIPLELP